jgi:predicted metal-binding membrane protein
MASSAADEQAAPLAERIAHHRRWTVAVLALVTLAAWAWLATRPMMMAPSLPMVVLMWSVMMAAMMLPSAAPAILLYGRVAAQHRGAVGPSWHFLAGYLVAWSGFSLIAAAVQVAATTSGLLDPMNLHTSAAVSAALWIAAGLYQLTPLKGSCLAQCRSPAAFLARHWRAGPAAGLRLGLAHGLFCIGCCGALMALLFVGGAMNLAWAAALAVIVAVEKIMPRGDRIGRLAGLAMVGWGVARIVTPALSRGPPAI